jgi:hypothetical protein
MDVAIRGRIDKAQNSFMGRLSESAVVAILRANINRSLRRQLAFVKNVFKLSAVILVEKHVVAYQWKATGFGMHGQGECRERSLRWTDGPKGRADALA